MKTALTIAGSDSSGGAGVQADIKTMTANGVFAMSAITALTAQNTTGVTDIFETTPRFLAEQLDAIFTDIYPDAVKIGMVSSAELIDTIAEKLHAYEAKHIVVDPVMVATSGSKLLQTEQALTAQVAEQLFARCGVQGTITEKIRPSGVVYEFGIRAPEQVTRMHELFGTTGSETSLQIDPELIRCQTCVSAYIGSAFLCSGTVIDPQKEYNIEFLTSRTNLAKDFEALLAEHEFAPHRTRRNGVNLIYVKNSANVERILAFMGAANAAAQIRAQKAVKQVRNQINRHTNCDTANLSKTARANAQTLKAIRFLKEQNALETLPEVLQDAAAKRLAYPDLSLTALCACFDPAVSKSGLSHRMKKLESLADTLRQRLEQEAEEVKA